MMTSTSLSSFSVDVESIWKARKEARRSPSAASLLSLDPSKGSLKSAASFGSLPGVAARTPSRAGFQFKAIKNLPPPGTPSMRSKTPGLDPMRLSRKAKFDQLTSWLEKQDPASEIGQKLMKAYPKSPPRPKTTSAGVVLGPGGEVLPPIGGGISAAQAAAEAAEAEEARLAKKEKLKSSAFVQGASNALNSRFTDMFKAFQYVDLDRSGTLDEKEIRRALDLWNMPITNDKLQDLIAACDHDGDGQVDYKEFVDVLARDTVAPAAMGKRDMQSKEAMGVDSQEMLAHQLGHGKHAKHSVSINDPEPTAEDVVAAVKEQRAQKSPPKEDKPLPTNPNREKLKSSTFVKMASDGLNSRFSDMFKAFQYVDLDRSGTLNEKEIRRALDMWNIPLDHDKLLDLISACDADGNGEVDYKEFVDVLARDTVAPAAMGKRDMQSLEAMGVDSQEAMAAQLGHAKQKHISVSINDPDPDEAPKAAPPPKAAPSKPVLKPTTVTPFMPPAAAPAALPPAPVKPKAKAKAPPPAATKVASKVMNEVSDVTQMKFATLQKSFRAMDKDKSHALSPEELLKAFAAWNMGTTPTEIEALMAACDENGDGVIDYGEFTRGMAKLSEKRRPEASIFRNSEGGGPGPAMILKHDLGAAAGAPATEAELQTYMSRMKDKIDTKYAMMRSAFRAIDEDKDGRLSVAELTAAVEHFALPFPITHLGSLFAKFDKDGSNGIDFKEFTEALKAVEMDGVVEAVTSAM